jgi:hypothetical protein
MAIHCVNYKSHAVIDLASELGVSPLIAAAKIGVWQDKNGLDSFPTAEDLSTPITEEVVSEEIIEDSIETDYTGFEVGSKIEPLISVKAPTALESLEPNQEKGGNGFKDLHESILFAGLEGMRSFKAVNVLTNIMDSTQFELSKDDRFYFDQAKKLLNKTGAKVKMVSEKEFVDLDEDFSETTIMAYNPKDNSIYMSRDVIANFTPELVISSFIHEVAHSTTVEAYRKPANSTEQMLKDTIDQGFLQYKELAKENGEIAREYGFENPIEFIAEIYSNPNFRTKVSKLSSFWNEFIHAIRRLFNLSATKENTKFVTDAVLFSAVDSFVQLNKATWKGTNIDQKFLAKEANEDLFTDLSTVENRIDNVINKFNQSIEKSIDHFNYEKKKVKGNKADGIKAYLKSLYELQDDINRNSEANKAKSIIDFTSYMGDNLKRIETTLNTVDLTNIESTKNIINTYDNYLSLYSVIDDAISIIQELKEDENQKFIKPAQLTKIEDQLSIHKGKFESLKKKMTLFKRKALALRINDIKYFPDVEKKHYDRLSKEYKAAKIPENKETWIARQMNGRDKALIETDVKDKINDLLNNPSIDIYASDVLLSSAINVSDPLIQILNQWLQEIDNERIKTEKAKDIEFRNIYQDLVKDKGTNNIKDLYKNILQTDSNGKQFLLSEYHPDLDTQVYQKIKDTRAEYEKKRNDIWKEGKEVKELFGVSSKEYKVIINRVKESKAEGESKVKAIERENFNLDKKGKFVSIKAKWKVKQPNLSKAEKAALDFFIDVTETGSKDTRGKNSLIKYVYKAKFYELPKVHKSTAERLWTGEGAGVVKDSWQDLTKVRTDDIEYGGKDIGLDNKQINSLKINFRGDINPKSQSTDLVGIYRLEYKNTNAYKIKQDAKMDINIMTDVVQYKKFYDRSGTTFVTNRNTGKINIKEEGTSNTLKMINNMVETRFYGVYKKSNTKIAGVDANKFVQKLNGASSFLALTGNVAASTMNVLNAGSQLFFESFIKGQYITASGIAKANEIYFKTMGDTIADNVKPIDESFVNQILEEFHVNGLINLSDSNFLQTDLIKKGLSMQTMHSVTTSGEHYVKSVISMTVLDGVKVMDDNFNFIDKEGNIVDESKAASLLDMYSPDPDTGLLTVSDKVVYTTNSKTTKYNEGGKDKVDALIYKKMYDSIGNYRQVDQPDLYRHWWGNMVGLYRKYLIPMGTARLRGIESSFKKSEDLIDHEKRFSYALQENEEGTYVSLIRFIATAFKEKQFYLLSESNWGNLTDYEKHNIKRSVAELVTIFVLLPIMTALASGGADGDDDEMMYFMAYASRRLETELSQYLSITENFKVLRSPIPSTRLIETGMSLFGAVFNPFNWDELTTVYEKGIHEGENKLKVKAEKQVPIVKEFIKSYKDLYEYQNSNWGTGI